MSNENFKNGEEIIIEGEKYEKNEIPEWDQVPSFNNSVQFYLESNPIRIHHFQPRDKTKLTGFFFFKKNKILKIIFFRI